VVYATRKATVVHRGFEYEYRCTEYRFAEYEYEETLKNHFLNFVRSERQAVGTLDFAITRKFDVARGFEP
jgi:hypothetical protein